MTAVTARVKRIVLRQIIDDKRCLSAPITFNSVMHVNDYLGRGHTYLRRKLNNNQHIISSSGEPKKFFIVERINSQLVKTEKEELLRYFKTYRFYDGDIDLNGNESINYAVLRRKADASRRSKIRQLLVKINIHYSNLVEAEKSGSQDFKKLQQLLRGSA